MPRNGSGAYNLPAGNPVVPSTVIRSDWANTTLNDIAAALSGSLSKDGQTTATGNQPMGGYRHTGVGTATSGTNYAQAAQVQKSAYNILASVTGADSITGTLSFGTVTFTPGMVVTLIPAANNTGGATLQINGGTVNPIKTGAGDDLPADALVAGRPTVLQWDGAEWLMAGGSATYSEIVGALGYTPVDKAGDTMTGPLIVPYPFKVTNTGYAGVEYYNNGPATPVLGGALGGWAVYGWNGTAPVYVGGETIRAAEAWTPTANGTEIQFRVTFNGTTVPFLAGKLLNTGHWLGRGYVQEVEASNPGSGASITYTFTNGQSKVITLAGPLTITGLTGIPVGSIMRLTFINTDLGVVTWPSAVVWPNGSIAPDLAAGPYNRAVVVIANDGTYLLANASAF